MSSSPQEYATAHGPRRWKHGGPPVVGLIGGIGSGKSRVASLLAARGAVVIDADRVGHEVLDEPDVRRRVALRFGPGVERRDGAEDPGGARIDRRALGKIVFADAAALRDLEAMLHPRMEREFEHRIAAAREGGAPLVVLDAAILLERGWDRFCDLVAFVDAPWDVRLERVSSSRGWDAATLAAREAAQWPVATKRERADLVLRNDATPEALEGAVLEFLESLSPPTDSDREGRASSGGTGRAVPAHAVAGEAS